MQEKQRQADAGRARRSPGLSPLAAAQPGLARFCDRRNHRAPERTRRSAAAADAAAQRAADRAAQRRRRAACARPPRRRRPVRTSRRSNGTCSRSPARSRRCSVPIISSNRSRRSAANSPKSVSAITEAMPRRAIESIENEIRSLSRRIDENRQSGSDGQTLAGIERALGEIREVLRSLTPAEQLAGYDEAIRNLGAKLDLILRSQRRSRRRCSSSKARSRRFAPSSPTSPPTTRWRGFPTTCTRCRPRSTSLPRADGNSDAFAVLEQRIAALTSTLESRERPAASDNSEQLESALRALSERLDRMPVGNDNASAFAHLEQRVSYLLERLEASGDRSAARRRSRPGRGRAAGHPALSSNASTPAWSRSPTATAMSADTRPADGLRHRRSRQARTVRHPLQPVGNRPPHPGFARDRSQHARPRGRSPVDDRRRSAHGSHRAAAPRRADLSPRADRSARGSAAPR